ncbi:putative WEB family protein At4g17210 [Solanum stenotomum]|uniref:putative WEB family protein At4g17210 n=1 Tax=Solanum stenotomum TaxID=172797 RepID=UPI0020D1DD92|nr:putative WEB family protein At4g17210 [Solanum stenotomum]
MGEIDTKSIESVHAALSLFGEKSCDHKKKYRSTSCINEVEKENDTESALKYLANLKVQLEAKDSAHKQALLKLDHHENTVDELCTLLMSSELEKEIYMIECRGLRVHVHELELRIQEMDDRFLESVMIREQLSHATDELRDTQRELEAARDAKLEALSQVEVMENSLSTEKLKTDELSRDVSKLNETVAHLRMTATKVEESAALLELEAANAKEEVVFMRHQLEMMQDLENELLDKFALIDSMKAELQELNELRASSEKVPSDAGASEMKKLNEALELQERKNWDQSGYISLLESELRQLKGELNKANEESTRANADFGTINIELDQIKKEMIETREKESEAQVEIAFLKSELHKGKSKISASEVTDSVAKSEKSALHLALQQLALEAKNENRRLKETGKASEEGKVEAKAYMTIPKEEYDQLHDEPNEIQVLKKELKTSTVKINELRTRAEQAISRAEAAEKGKSALENQIKRWKEHKERKKAALAALREESISREITEYKSDTSPKTLQPLGKVLKMKF